MPDKTLNASTNSAAISTSPPVLTAQNKARFARITGTGSFLPPNRVSNDDLVEQLAETGVATSNDWIVERTGIKARHFSETGVMTSELAVAAAENALQAAGLQASDIDLIIVATSTPRFYPLWPKWRVRYLPKLLRRA